MLHSSFLIETVFPPFEVDKCGKLNSVFSVVQTELKCTKSFLCVLCSYSCVMLFAMRHMCNALIRLWAEAKRSLLVTQLTLLRIW